MAYGLLNGHVTDDFTWPPKLMWGSTVGYPTDSLASCYRSQTGRDRLLITTSRLLTSTTMDRASTPNCRETAKASARQSNEVCIR